MSDLNGMEMFVAVAEAKGFRAAGERLGVSGAAVSQALRRLEERLGITPDEMDGGHLPALARPKELVATLEHIRLENAHAQAQNRITQGMAGSQTRAAEG